MDLDDLIERVQESAMTEEPLDRLAAAMVVKSDMDDVTDSLIGHFVDLARQSGASWSEIGAAMGVTKQAAQQRHTSERRRPREHDRPWRFGQRFTGRARNAVREANEAAVALNHDEVSTEHLLLGLLAVPQGLAGKILADAGVTPTDVVAGVVPGESGRRRDRGRRPRLPFQADAKALVERSLANALRLGHNYIGTEHLLLAAFDVPDGVAARVLLDKGLTKESVEVQVVDRLKRAS